MLVLMLVLVAMAIGVVTLVVVVMLMRVMMLFRKTCHVGVEGVFLLDSRQDITAVKQLPRGGDYSRLVIQLANEGNGSFHLVRGKLTLMAQHNSRGMGDLVAKKFAEVLEIHLAFGGIHHGGVSI